MQSSYAIMKVSIHGESTEDKHIKKKKKKNSFILYLVVYFHYKLYKFSFKNNNLLHLYSAFLGTQSTLHSKGGISSSTTSVQHPPGWCDGSHIAPERPPHTSLLVERRQSDEANQCMEMIRMSWWSEASGHIWPVCRVTPLLFFEGHPGIFNDHRESGPRFYFSSEGWCVLQYIVPIIILGIRTHTDHRVNTPCWSH